MPTASQVIPTSNIPVGTNFIISSPETSASTTTSIHHFTHDAYK